MFSDVDWAGNLALGKPTTQSSNRHENDAWKAVDGSRSGNNKLAMCSETKSAAGSWWKVDLGAVYVIRHVVITNREDCCRKLNNV